MSGEVTQTPSLNSTEKLHFATFSAANDAAIRLLQLVQLTASPPALQSDDDEAIGYQLMKSPSNGHELRNFWRIGAGPSKTILDKGLDHEKPDILLCPPGGTLGARAARTYIKDIHVSLEFNPKSGVLVLTTNSNRPIIYRQGGRGDEDIVLSTQDKPTCVMRRTRNVLEFGEYEFILEFINQTQGKDDLKAKYGPTYPGLYPPPSVDSACMAHPRVSGRVWLHQKIPNTSVTSGVDIYTGEPVAVKQLQTTADSARHIKRRLRLARQSKYEQNKGILGVIDMWCEHSLSHPCLFRKSPPHCEHISYSSPLANENFADSPWFLIAVEERLSYFYQTLSGLSELHEHGIVHGNILPESLLLLTERSADDTEDKSSKRAVILISMKRLKKHDPSICVAPELWKPGKQKGLDKTKADIWALAASWLLAFLRPPKNTTINEDSYRTLQKSLDDQVERKKMSESLAELLRRMLAWDPQSRPSAQAALADKVWEPIVARMTEAEGDRKRKRKEKMKVPDGIDKRVRVLSPETDEHLNV
ncbi:kinase-like domain-containing protein [Trichoderma austrokoningii]